MGGSPPPPPPTIVYAPPPPPPPPPTKVPTQALKTQTVLDEASAAQQRLNMEKGAELDRINEEFFAGQDIRRGQATGAEQRLTIGATGEETRATVGKQAEEQRTTDLQQEVFRRYKENRDYEQSQQAYRS